MNNMKDAIYQIIMRHTNYPMLDRIDESNLMFTYGSTEEFEKMIESLEETFGAILFIPIDEIGEVTVEEFTNRLIEILKDDDEE